MSVSEPHPYSLLIIPPKTNGGSYQWAIRRNGKFVQRSDRNFLSEAEARETALAAMDKLLAEAGDR